MSQCSSSECIYRSTYELQLRPARSRTTITRRSSIAKRCILLLPASIGAGLTEDRMMIEIRWFMAAPRPPGTDNRGRAVCRRIEPGSARPSSRITLGPLLFSRRCPSTTTCQLQTAVRQIRLYGRGRTTRPQPVERNDQSSLMR